jgi:uncharacterized protein YbcC (UPF0753/DUF2309 family)
MSNQSLNNCIEQASSIIGKTWPLYGFVTSNPLSGYEALDFQHAIQEATKYIGGAALPTGTMFREAREKGEFDADILQEILTGADFFQDQEHYLKVMESAEAKPIYNSTHLLDRIVTKWLCAFMDEGMAEWEMPGRSKGFFASWRRLAIYDQELGFSALTKIPETADEALTIVLAGYSYEKQANLFKYHIAALPGWTGYIKYRMTEGSPWQQKYPVTLKDYLAVRLWIAKHLCAEAISAPTAVQLPSESFKLQYVWLKAWEKSWQHLMTARLTKNLTDLETAPKIERTPAVQMVFCIDTRSELIRRHIEAKGEYETFGYAGFFGIATDYQDQTSDLIRKSCPPILSSAYTIYETPIPGKNAEVANFQRKKAYQKFADFLTTRMKNMLPSAFGYVEGAGLFYGCSLLWRTIFPRFSMGVKTINANVQEAICRPDMHSNSSEENKNNIALDEKVAIVRSAFILLGWKKFAPLVVFTGHGSHSANNPFGSSLDCGACAASPGRHNARMLASLANLPEVRNSLREQFGIDIPATTFFLGAEHNTATDDIVLFDAEVPESHHPLTRRLKADLSEISQSAITERLGHKNGAKIALNKSENWAETRPEWGLAGNAGFIIAPRSITKDMNLGGRCFLHSYDWQMDEEGLSLEMIMQGPMVVTQWINNHYYFSTVNNEKFGGGSKITHNVTGKFGVVQGNGGDLKIGLPLQSVNSSDKSIFHQPLRLSVIVQSPLQQIEAILLKNNQLQQLIDNEWIYLMIMDPLSNNEIRRYQKNSGWSLVTNEKAELPLCYNL